MKELLTWLGMACMVVGAFMTFLVFLKLSWFLLTVPF